MNYNFDSPQISIREGRLTFLEIADQTKEDEEGGMIDIDPAVAVERIVQAALNGDQNLIAYLESEDDEEFEIEVPIVDAQAIAAKIAEEESPAPIPEIPEGILDELSEEDLSIAHELINNLHEQSELIRSQRIHLRTRLEILKAEEAALKAEAASYRQKTHRIIKRKALDEYLSIKEQNYADAGCCIEEGRRTFLAILEKESAEDNGDHSKQLRMICERIAQQALDGDEDLAAYLRAPVREIHEVGDAVVDYGAFTRMETAKPEFSVPPLSKEGEQLRAEVIQMRARSAALRAEAALMEVQTDVTVQKTREVIRDLAHKIYVHEIVRGAEEEAMAKGLSSSEVQKAKLDAALRVAGREFGMKLRALNRAMEDAQPKNRESKNGAWSWVKKYLWPPFSQAK